MSVCHRFQLICLDRHVPFCVTVSHMGADWAGVCIVPSIAQAHITKNDLLKGSMRLQQAVYLLVPDVTGPCTAVG